MSEKISFSPVILVGTFGDLQVVVTTSTDLQIESVSLPFKLTISSDSRGDLQDLFFASISAAFRESVSLTLSSMVNKPQKLASRVLKIERDAKGDMVKILEFK